MINHQVRTLSLFCDHQILHKVESILRDPGHALYGEFQHLPHGCQFRSLGHVCLSVTCHLLFWQNDQDLLHAAVVKQVEMDTEITISTES